MLLSALGDSSIPTFYYLVIEQSLQQEPACRFSHSYKTYSSVLRNNCCLRARGRSSFLRTVKVDDAAVSR
jgi:hypothetical protein